MNVSYKLLKLNRKIRITHKDRSIEMLYRDFRAIVRAFECEYSEKFEAIIGPNEVIEVRVEDI